MADRLRIKRLFHTTQAVTDVAAARIAYLEAFGGMTFLEGYHPGEDRDMALVYVADQMLEPMAPRDAGALDRVFARYLSRHGEGWHSFAFTVADAAGAARLLRAGGCEITTEYANFFLLHPRAAGGVLLEFCDVEIPQDPYYLPGWNRDWAMSRTDRPRRMAYVCCVVPDAEVTARFFTEQLDGRATGEGRLDWPQPARFVDVAVADARLRIVAPDGADGPLGRYLAGRRSGVYAVGWEVAEVDAAAAIMRGAGLAAEPVPGGDVAYEIRLAGARHWICRVQGGMTSASPRRDNSDAT